MKDSIATLEDMLLKPSSLAVDVAALVLPGKLSAQVAWATATAQLEQVHIGTLEQGGQLGETAAWAGVQPRLAALGEQPYLLFLRGPDLSPSVLSIPEGEPIPLFHEGHCQHARLAGGSKMGWTAWCERGGREAFIRIGALEKGGVFRTLARVPGQWCDLAARGDEARVIWLDGEILLSARLDERSMGDPEVLASEPGAELPCLCPEGPEGWFAAWQGPVAEGVLRWPRLAHRVDGRWRRLDPPLPHEDLHLERSSAGEDQGWECPTLFSAAANQIWLAGRSAQGFRAQALTGERWAPRLDISRRGWSGRSHSMAMIQLGDDVQLLRGTPEGLAVVKLPTASTRRGGPPRPPAASTRRGGPPRPPADGLLFGDIHQHTLESDGLGTVEDAYRRARYLYGHDFAAVTDHDGLAGGCLGPLTWRRQCRLADAFHEPGRFITLKGFEFTGSRQPGRGHKCVYFDDDVPDQLPGRDPVELDAMLARHRALVVPHHTAWTGADMEHHDPGQQPAWEICSVHGSYEHGGDQPLPPRPDVVLPGQFVRDALDAGLIFGLIGGTDAHGLRWHHGVGFKADPHRCGLTALFCEPTRESLFAALRARRCYATSGSRIILSLDLEGAPMGSVLTHHGPVVLHVEVQGTAPIRRLSLVINGEEAVTASSPTPQASLTHRFQSTEDRPRGYCHVTVLQRDGEMAWSSPIWFTSS